MHHKYTVTFVYLGASSNKSHKKKVNRNNKIKGWSNKCNRNAKNVYALYKLKRGNAYTKKTNEIYKEKCANTSLAPIHATLRFRQ